MSVPWNSSPILFIISDDRDATDGVWLLVANAALPVAGYLCCEAERRWAALVYVAVVSSRGMG